MISLRLVSIALVFPLLSAPAAGAGDCRAALQPLLLENPPDADALAEVRVVCEREAIAGDADALYQSALLHLGPIDWDVNAAIPRILSAADAGVPEAQYWLAWQYEEGPLLANDPGRALYWYEIAGDNEHRLALDRLATAYQNGELGLAPSVRKAAEMRARAERCKDQSG